MLKRILGLLVVLSWLFALPCVAAELNYNAGPGQMMAKNLPDAVTDGTAKLVGPKSASQTMRVSIQLPIQNKAKLDQLVSDLYDPKSPNFHKWLTVEQVIAQFAPSQDDYNAVINFAESNGLKVEKQWPSRDNLGVSGTVANIEKAFNVKMNVYQHPTENRTFYSNDRTPVVNLPFPLAHVAGLDNYSIFRPVSQRQGTAQTSNATQQDPQAVAYTPSQIRTAYGLDSSNTGAGQTVGVFIVGGYNPTAITQFFSQYSIPYTGTITPIAIGSLTTTCTNGSCEIYNQAYSTEVEIDVEMVALMAPSANINVYCSQQGLDWSQAFEQMKADGNTVKVFSMSMAVSQDDPTDDVVLEEMAAQGQSLFVASGDGGPYSTSYHYTIWPAECHYVTDVGGTSLVLNADNTWNSEVVWNGSGGGYYPPDNIGIPSYQDPNIITPANGGSTTYRNIPDVAALADMRRVCVEAIPLVLHVSGGMKM